MKPLMALEICGRKRQHIILWRERDVFCNGSLCFIAWLESILIFSKLLIMSCVFGVSMLGEGFLLRMLKQDHLVNLPILLHNCPSFNTGYSPFTVQQP